MNATIVEIIVIALLGAGVFGYGYSHGEAHIQAQWNVDKIAQAAALQKAQAALIEEKAKQEAVTQAVAQNYETKLRAAADSSAALDSLIVRYEAQLRQRAVPAAPAAAPGSAPAASVPPSYGSIDEAAAAAIGSCEHDSAQLGSLIDWVKGQYSIAVPVSP